MDLDDNNETTLTTSSFSNGSPNYLAGLMHLILCGTTGWAINQTNSNETPFSFGCFLFLFGHGALGVLRFTHPAVNGFFAKFYNFTSHVTISTPIALVNAQFHLKLEQPSQYSYSLLSSAILPPFTDTVLPDTNEMISDLVMICNLTSLSYLSAVKEKYWGLGLAIIAGLNHFTLGTVANRYDVPKILFSTIGLVFFTIFAVNCLTE